MEGGGDYMTINEEGKKRERKRKKKSEY